MSRFLFPLLAIFVSAFPVFAAEADSSPGKPWAAKFDWGEARSDGQVISLLVQNTPVGGVVRVPRLFNSYEKLYLQSDESKQMLKFKPEVDHWLITLPKNAAKNSVIVMETVGAPRPPKYQDAITPEKNGTFELPACLATVHGEKLRFEPQPHKNTVGYWAVAKDWCEWSLSVPQAGTYDVYVWQGCGKGQGGSTVDVAASESEFTFTVEDTGHFQNFKERKIGRLKLAAGNQSLTFRPKVKAKNAVMDVRLVVLKPTKDN